MASTTICDYQILADGSFRLGADGDDKRILHFTVPNDLHTGNALSRRAILTFAMRPATDCRLKMRLHGADIINRNYDASHTRTLQEVFSIKTCLHIGEDFGEGSIGVNSYEEPVQFQCQALDGTVHISDVVVWYQINRDG